jgi:hypothetical protein
MVIDYEPALAIVDISKAVAGRQGFHFSGLRVGEGVVTLIYSRIAVHPDQLITKSDLLPGRTLKAVTK